MDNASKALIMAGAILISVSLIGIGIYMIATVDDIKEKAIKQTDSLPITSINSKIEIYLGTEIKGSQVEQLVREINAINRTNSMYTQVQLLNAGGVSLVKKAEDYAEDNCTYELDIDFDHDEKYTATVTDYDSDGYISEITIEKFS